MIKLFKEDCIEGMKRLDDRSVDCIVTDLPFNMTANTWDKSVIDISALWTQFERILKPCRSVVLFAAGKFAYKLMASNPDWYRYKYIWVKNMSTNFVHAKNAPLHKFEEILIFSNGVVNHASCSNRRMKYNPQGVISCHVKHHNRLKAFGNTVGARPSHIDSYVQKQTGYPSDVLFYDVPYNVGKLHPSQKPVDLLEFLIKTYTDEGEVVLDATMGSGSTGVAAINTGRKFIGYEIEQKFFDIAQNRIDKTLTDNGGFLK